MNPSSREDLDAADGVGTQGKWFSVRVLLAAFCTCSFFPQLALVEGTAGSSSAGKDVPVASRVVATATYEYDRQDRKLQLVVVREPPTVERQGFRHRYRITDEAVSSTRKAGTVTNGTAAVSEG